MNILRLDAAGARQEAAESHLRTWIKESKAAAATTYMGILRL